ncbi:MAG: alpha/beta fold hydrolase [Capsulimonadales bacterium]|nr:alpha/beta fold hydrolase [Capsulimonadales bacterium]
MSKETGNREGSNPLGNIVKGLLIAGTAVGVTALANAYVFYRTPPLTSPFPGGEVRYFPTPDGDIFYKKMGEGPPLLLIHGIGAGCSSFEWRHVWEPLAEGHTVYALDLPGFGKSDKPAIEYTPELFIGWIADFCRNVIKVGDGRGECDVIATSLSAAYVIALSQRDPSLFHRLVLVAPTGIEELAEEPNAVSAAVRATLKTPVLGTAFYNGVTSKGGIRRYLTDRIYADPSLITDEVIERYYVASHQPGADNVLPYFVSGFLNINIREAFKGVVDLPLLVWGRQATETPVGMAESFLLANANAKLEVIEEAGMLPHEEQPEAFLAAVRPFLLSAGPESSDTTEVETAETGSETGAVPTVAAT